MARSSGGRPIIGAIVGLALGALLGPVAGCALILTLPSLSGSNFVSAADGSMGPAFWACSGTWAAFAIGGLILGGIGAVAIPRLRAQRNA
jgi:hypothetical protein